MFNVSSLLLDGALQPFFVTVGPIHDAVRLNYLTYFMIRTCHAAHLLNLSPCRTDRPIPMSSNLCACRLNRYLCNEYKQCTTVHRCIYGDAPAYLADLITTSAAATGRAGLRSAASSAVAVPRTTSSFGDRSFAAAGSRAWNKLPPPVLHCLGCDMTT